MDQLNPEDPAQGVRVLGVVESAAPLRTEYAPEHPMANDQGYIFRPNVSLVEEMADMISASRTYQTNMEVANSAKQLLLATLRLGE